MRAIAIAAWLPALQAMGVWGVAGSAPAAQPAFWSALSAAPPAALVPLLRQLPEGPAAAALQAKMTAVASLPAEEQARLAAVLETARAGAVAGMVEAAGRETAVAASAESMSRLGALRQELDGALASRVYGEEAALRAGRDGVAREEGVVRRALVSRSLAAGAAALEEESMLKDFIDDFHADLRRQRPDLFQLKLKKAAESEAAFNRAFPQLFYEHLRGAPEAGALARSKRVLLAGDLHPDNTELADHADRRVLQANDFDDAGRAPAALEIARVLVGAGLLAEGAERGRLAAEARAGYKKALGLRFKEWADAIADEHAVRRAEAQDMDWPHRAGKPVADAVLAGRLLGAAGLDAADWKVFDRSGSGLSSIGMRRYMFVSKKHGHVWELKQLRPSALLFFTGEAPPRSELPRVEEAWKELRKAPVEMRGLRFDGLEWSLRRREKDRTSLAYGHAASAARVLGGLAAQMHRQLADEADLKAALDSVTPELVTRALDFMGRMRGALIELMRKGTWG